MIALATAAGAVAGAIDAAIGAAGLTTAGGALCPTPAARAVVIIGALVVATDLAVDVLLDAASTGAAVDTVLFRMSPASGGSRDGA